MLKDINGLELKEGDSVFNTKTGYFGKVYSITPERNPYYDPIIFRAKHDIDCRPLRGHDIYLWATTLTIKLNPDTPENRLFLKLKYA
jgi:hypothetical protein